MKLKEIDEEVIEHDVSDIDAEKAKLEADKERKKQLKKEERMEVRNYKKSLMKQRIKRFFSFYNVNNFLRELRSIGVTAGTSSIAFVLFALIFLVFICFVLLKLNWQYVLILAVLLLACTPYTILMMFTSKHQEQRFSDITGYMEQLIYSFHKTGKIRDALMDVYEVSTGDIKDTIYEMIYTLDHDNSTSKLFEKALAIMQNKYDCTRLQVLHDYLISVESNGGDSSLSLRIMLDDLRAWVERVTTYQADRLNVRAKTAISICCAMLSCGFMVNMIPTEYVTQIIGDSFYQIGTLIVLALNIILYMVSCTNLSVSYLDNEMDKKHGYDIRRKLEYLAEYPNKNHVKSTAIKAAIMLPLIGLAVYLQYTPAMALAGVTAFFIITHDFTYKRTCLKRVTKDIKKAYPVWLRNLVLYLQMDNVHVAIKNSYLRCPYVMKPELSELINNLSSDPISMRPYLKFLSAYNVPELKLASHYLYSLATFGSEDSMSQLNYLIEQNGKLEIVEEKIRNEDSISLFSLIVLLPMLLAVVKLMIDLILFLSIFMGYLSSAGTL